MLNDYRIAEATQAAILYLPYDPPERAIAPVPDEIRMPQVPAQARFGDLYGASRQMRQLYRMIARVAPTHANVLIEGESGTGKELVASTLYLMSGRAGQPLVAINCGAISPQLMEAELFGHERGSFTGAMKSRKGCFERADGGILFLDEVTEMSMDMQVKLLRILETGRFCRVGADSETQVKVRVIAATNRCPRQAVRDGLLRSDLYYRLSVFPLQVPPLRERGEDVLLMANVFLERLNKADHTAKVFSPASRQFMQTYSWPGNVRELKNAIQRAFIMADGELDLTCAMAPAGAVRQPELRDDDGNCITVQVGSTLEDAQRRLICATLGHYRGNKTLAAAALGVSLKTLYNRLKEYESANGATTLAGMPAHPRTS